MTPFDMTTSKVLSAYGIFSESTFLISKLVMFALARLFFARVTISSVKSTPQTRPLSPTNLLATNRSNPAPQPRSNTTSPYWILPKENGLPTPQNDSRRLGAAFLIMSGSYLSAIAPSLPVGYWNFPAAEIETSAYLFLITFLISFKFSGETTPVF